MKVKILDFMIFIFMAGGWWSAPFYAPCSTVISSTQLYTPYNVHADPLKCIMEVWRENVENGESGENGENGEKEENGENAENGENREN